MKQDSNNYWEQLERLEKLIRASELKAGIIFSFHSLILGLFVDKLSYFQEIIQGSLLLIILVSLWLVFVLVSIFYCFKCFMPRMESKYKKNVFFFKDAVYSFGNKKEYSEKLMKVCGDEHEMYEHLSLQIHAESKIIDKKFTCVQKSIKFFGLSFIFIILIVITYLVGF